eukprot:TRINITY_DN9449_c0_g2_i1.p1 TRINITY_DN9449_c0_g2~~TRINITY_DN9449_c0_g2_i1.p1  ORF type:complete len:214 (-),score=24.80 TRINITY_DN9449_c0_g2_i1:296-937(-)
MDKFSNFKVRDWNDFFNFKRFGLPKEKTIKERFITNFNYYLLNYLIINAIIILFFFNPATIVIIFADFIGIMALYFWVNSKKTSIIFKAGDLVISVVHVVIFLITISSIVILMVDRLALIISIFITLLHILLRKRSTKSKMSITLNALKNENGINDPTESIINENIDLFYAIKDEVDSAKKKRTQKEFQKKKDDYNKLADKMKEKYFPKEELV